MSKGHEHEARNNGFRHHRARNQARVRWIWAGVVIGGAAGFIAGVVTQAWSTAPFVSEQVMSGFYFGGVAGVLGYFLLTYDHGRRQKVIDDNRKAMVRLTALLERTNNQD